MGANDRKGLFSKNTWKLAELPALHQQAFAIVMDAFSDDPVVQARVERVNDGYFVDLMGSFEGKEVYLTGAVAVLLDRPCCSIGIHCSYPHTLNAPEVSKKLLGELAEVMEKITGTRFSCSAGQDLDRNAVWAA